jgi:AraC-like DNA-binding protein
MYDAKCEHVKKRLRETDGHVTFRQLKRELKKEYGQSVNWKVVQRLRAELKLPNSIDQRKAYIGQRLRETGGLVSLRKLAAELQATHGHGSLTLLSKLRDEAGYPAYKDELENRHDHARRLLRESQFEQSNHSIVRQLKKLYGIGISVHTLQRLRREEKAKLREKK